MRRGRVRAAQAPHRERRRGGASSGGGELAALRRQAALVRLGASGLGRVTAEGLAADLAREAAEALDAAAVEVLERAGPGGRLVVRAAVGAHARAPGSLIEVAPGSAEERALGSGAPAELGAITPRPCTPGAVEACVAVGAPDSRWGVIVARARERPFLPAHVDFLTSVGHILAGVVERERLLALGQRGAELPARMAGVVAHDLNNVLAAIGASVSGIERQLPTCDGFAEDFRLVDDAVRRGGRLVRRLLAFSGQRVDGGRPCDLNAVMSEARGMLDRLLLGEIAVSVGLTEKVLPVSAASGTLEPLIVGLAMSVAESLPRGATLRLETRHVAPAASGGGCRAGLMVAGAGAHADLASLVPAVERAGGCVEVAPAGDAAATTLLWPCADLEHAEAP